MTQPWAKPGCSGPANRVHSCCAGKYESASKLMTLIKHAESDAWLGLGLSFHLSVLPLTRQLACLSGFLWSRTLQARCEVLSSPDPAYKPPHTGTE